MADIGEPVYLGMKDGNLVEVTREEKITELKALGAIPHGDDELLGVANVVGEALVTINDSGIVPTEFKVLVLPDISDLERRAGSIPNFVVPEGVASTYAHGTTTGRIIAMSEAAFSYHHWSVAARVPQVGDRIVFARYAGMIVKGRPIVNEKGHVIEERGYRLLNDKDVAGILEF